MATVLLDFSKPHVLRSETEYQAAIAEIEKLLDEDVGEGSEGYDLLEFLSVLVEHYEDERYPMGRVTPQQAVTFMLEQKGMSRADLEEVMGGKSRSPDIRIAPPASAESSVGHGLFHLPLDSSRKFRARCLERGVDS